MNYTILKAEIDNDPLARGYSGMTDQQVVDSLNTVDRSRNRTSIPRSEIYENIEASALAGLTTLEVAKLNLAMSDNVDPFGNAVQVFTTIFGSGSATLTALSAARVETVSRAVELSISAINTGDVNVARSI